MTRSLNHLAQTVYIAMSKQEGGGTLPCLFSESDAPLLLRDSFTGDAVTEEAAGLTVEDSDSQAGQACSTAWSELQVQEAGGRKNTL